MIVQQVEREKEEKRIFERMRIQRQQREQHMALIRLHREQQQLQLKEKAAAAQVGGLGVDPAFSLQQLNQVEQLS